MSPNSCRSACACADLFAQPLRKRPKKADAKRSAAHYLAGRLSLQRQCYPATEHYLAAGEGRARARPHSGPPALIKRCSLNTQ
ncbi:hypothetical protein QQF64_002787 [Cirrhinus molitorella]|uniref:Uncharacterized protein n=1 Tax=Cirrhinus molitorella TaxID=172907 RepID=A0ABR3MR80_9TELE